MCRQAEGSRVETFFHWSRHRNEGWKTNRARLKRKFDSLFSFPSRCSRLFLFYLPCDSSHILPLSLSFSLLLSLFLFCSRQPPSPSFPTHTHTHRGSFLSFYRWLKRERPRGLRHNQLLKLSAVCSSELTAQLHRFFVANKTCTNITFRSKLHNYFYGVSGKWTNIVMYK